MHGAPLDDIPERQINKQARRFNPLLPVLFDQRALDRPVIRHHTHAARKAHQFKTGLPFQNPPVGKNGIGLEKFIVPLVAV